MLHTPFHLRPSFMSNSKIKPFSFVSYQLSFPSIHKLDEGTETNPISGKLVLSS